MMCMNIPCSISFDICHSFWSYKFFLLSLSLFRLYSLFALFHTNEIITRSFKCRTRNVSIRNSFIQLQNIGWWILSSFHLVIDCTYFILSFFSFPFLKLDEFLFQLNQMLTLFQWIENGKQEEIVTLCIHRMVIYTSHQWKLIHLTNYSYVLFCNIEFFMFRTRTNVCIFSLMSVCIFCSL